MKHTTITKVIGISLSAALLASVATGCGSASNGDTVQIINVSYDPTRELYTAYNELFAKHWKEKTGQDVEVTQSPMAVLENRRWKLPTGWRQMS